MTAPVLTEADRDLLALWHAALELGDIAEADRLEKIIDTPQVDAQRRLEAPEALASAARWYARCGVPVFPLVPAQKKPIIRAVHPSGHPCKGECGRLGHGLYDATTNLDQVGAWWQQWPQANIGTPTGITFDVFDVDGPVGVTALTDNDLTLTNIGVPIIGHAITPRGGGHHLFVEPTGRGNGTKILPGIDYRGAGGYVVLAPSRGQRKDPITDKPTGETALYAWSTPLRQIKAAQA